MLKPPTPSVTFSSGPCRTVNAIPRTWLCAGARCDCGEGCAALNTIKAGLRPRRQATRLSRFAGGEPVGVGECDDRHSNIDIDSDSRSRRRRRWPYGPAIERLFRNRSDTEIVLVSRDNFFSSVPLRLAPFSTFATACNQSGPSPPGAFYKSDSRERDVGIRHSGRV